MYETFFSFAEKPFTLTPNPRFLFLSHTHNEVYAHLLYGIDNRVGFIEVTGEVGTGKTTILRTLLSRLDDSKYRVAFIFNPKLRATELLQVINREFGLVDSGAGAPELIAALNDFLLEENRAGRTPVLVIDEAQNLSGEVLEQIRLLSNLETETDKLIQIVLVGQPELRQHLNDHSLRQFNQRIAVRCRLLPLNREETSAYISNRLKVAGGSDHGVFSPGSVARIFQCSGGIPRRINLICDRALLIAYTEEQHRVTAAHVKQSVQEIDGTTNSSIMSLSPWTLAASAAALIVLLASGVYLLPGVINNPSAVSAAPPDASPKITSQAPQVSGVVASCNAIFELWGSSLLSAGTLAAGFDFDYEFAARDLDLLRLRGSFADLQRLNMPLLIPLSEEQGGGYLAVTGKTPAGDWRVAPAYLGRDHLNADELSALGMRIALVPWKDFASIGYVSIPGTTGEKVRRLQFLLGLTGCLEVPTTGRYDATTIECIKRFQRDHGLVIDGLVGPRTLMLIYQAAGNYDTPHFS